MLIFGVQTLFYHFPSKFGIPSSPASDPCSTVHVSCLMCPQCPHWALTSPAAAHSLFLSPPPPLVSWALSSTPTHPGPTQCSCPKPSAPFSPHLGAGGPYMVDLGGNGMTLGVSKSLQVFGLQEPVPSLQLAGSDLLSAAAAHHHGRRRTFLLTLATI